MSNPFNPGNPQPPQPQQQQPLFSARVPEKVSRGVYCIGQIIHDSPKEFVIDFLQGLNRPFQVVARVIMTPMTMTEFAGTLQQNLDNYVGKFGQPQAPPPPPPNERRPSIEEIYEHYKLSEDVSVGAYCNSIIIGHGQTEFLFDFVSAFYPTPTIGARVILPAGQAPRFLGMLKNSIEQYKQRYMQQQPGQQQPGQQQVPPQQPPQQAPPTDPDAPKS